MLERESPHLTLQEVRFMYPSQTILLEDIVLSLGKDGDFSLSLSLSLFLSLSLSSSAIFAANAASTNAAQSCLLVQGDLSIVMELILRTSTPS
jgi:hypothetical protein